MKNSPSDAIQSAIPPTSSPVDLEGPGFLRLSAIVPGIIPVSRATWYAGTGSIYPKPVSLGSGRAKGYRKSDIKALVKSLEEGGAA